MKNSFLTTLLFSVLAVFSVLAFYYLVSNLPVTNIRLPCSHYGAIKQNSGSVMGARMSNYRRAADTISHFNENKGGALLDMSTTATTSSNNVSLYNPNHCSGYFVGST